MKQLKPVVEMTVEEKEELQRWIESRRRNFPTKAHVDKKSKDQSRRGELGIQGIRLEHEQEAE